jgi:predicted metalloprotease
MSCYDEEMTQFSIVQKLLTSDAVHRGSTTLEDVAVHLEPACELQEGCKSVTRVLREGNKSVTRVLQGCYKSVTRVLQEPAHVIAHAISDFVVGFRHAVLGLHAGPWDQIIK